VTSKVISVGHIQTFFIEFIFKDTRIYLTARLRGNLYQVARRIPYKHLHGTIRQLPYFSPRLHINYIQFFHPKEKAIEIVNLHADMSPKGWGVLPFRNMQLLVLIEFEKHHRIIKTKGRNWFQA